MANAVCSSAISGARAGRRYRGSLDVALVGKPGPPFRDGLEREAREDAVPITPSGLPATQASPGRRRFTPKPTAIGETSLAAARA